MDGVNLRFTDSALHAIARVAMANKTGARGLRAILESAMLDVMYEIPSQKTAREVVISDDVIEKHEQPLIVYEKTASSA